MKLLNYFYKQKIRKKIKSLYPDIDNSVLDVYCSNYGWTAPISLIVKLKDICRRRHPKLVLEFGSGLSTLLLAKALEKDSYLITVDQSMDYLYKTHKNMFCENKCKVMYVSWKDGVIDYKVIKNMVGVGKKANLILIDGPAEGDRFSEKAVSLYENIMAPDSVCFVDDTDRSGNDEGAIYLAGELNMRKLDFKDPIFTKHRYSIILPEGEDV